MTMWWWNFYLVHAALALTWLVWLWKDRQARPQWRRWTTLAGIVMVSANVMACWWVIITQTSLVPFLQRFGNAIVAVLVTAIVCAMCGKGLCRGLVVLCAFLGFLVWPLAFSSQ